MSTVGTFGPEMTRVIQRAAGLISQRKSEVYAETVTVIRQKLRFGILRSTLIALRGIRRKVAAANMGSFDFNL